MLEYIFFSETIRLKFADWLNQNSIAFQLGGDENELLILIDEDISEKIEDQIEEKYDQLLDENARLVDAEDNSEEAIHNVGIQFTRRDGTIGQVRIQPELANRIQPCMNPIELQAFVQNIVDAVEDRTYKRLCEK